MKNSDKRPDRRKKLKDPKIQERLKNFKKFKKKRLNQEEGLERLKRALEKLWQRLIKREPTKENLLYIFWNMNDESLRAKVWQELSKREDLEFSDLYDGLEKINDRDFEDKIWQKLLELGLTPDDLLCLIRFKEKFRKRAWEEFQNRLKKNTIRKHRAKAILTQIIEFVEELRTPAWKELKKLDPSYEEVSCIISLTPRFASVPFFADEVRSFLRKKFKIKDPNLRIIQQIHKLLGEIENYKGDKK